MTGVVAPRFQPGEFKTCKYGTVLLKKNGDMRKVIEVTNTQLHSLLGKVIESFKKILRSLNILEPENLRKLNVVEEIDILLTKFLECVEFNDEKSDIFLKKAFFKLKKYRHNEVSAVKISALSDLLVNKYKIELGKCVFEELSNWDLIKIEFASALSKYAPAQIFSILQGNIPESDFSKWKESKGFSSGFSTAISREMESKGFSSDSEEYDECFSEYASSHVEEKNDEVSDLVSNEAHVESHYEEIAAFALPSAPLLGEGNENLVTDESFFVSPSPENMDEEGAEYLPSNSDNKTVVVSTPPSSSSAEQDYVTASVTDKNSNTLSGEEDSSFQKKKAMFQERINKKEEEKKQVFKKPVIVTKEPTEKKLKTDLISLSSDALKSTCKVEDDTHDQIEDVSTDVSSSSSEENRNDMPLKEPPPLPASFPPPSLSIRSFSGWTFDAKGATYTS